MPKILITLFMHLYEISFRAGGESYSFTENFSYPRNYPDQNLIRTMVMAAIGRFKQKNNITAKTVESSVSY